MKPGNDGMRWMAMGGSHRGSIICMGPNVPPAAAGGGLQSGDTDTPLGREATQAATGPLVLGRALVSLAPAGTK
eukprot:2491518-Prorocentrum_lima.AAC.1